MSAAGSSYDTFKQGRGPANILPWGGIQHLLRGPAQAWGDACCSCIHRSGSTTSPQAFFPSKPQYKPSVLPSHLSIRSKVVGRQCFGDRREGSFFERVSEPQVTLVENRELLAAPGLVKVFGLHRVTVSFPAALSHTAGETTLCSS